MIRTPHTLNTHCRSSSYIYIVCQHLLLRLHVIRMQPNLYMLLVSQSTVKGREGSRWFTWFCHGVLLLRMIKTPHTLHTHSRSSSYIYLVFQHLLLWLVVKRIQPQPDICLVHSDSWFLTWIMLLTIIGASHPLHTHNISTLYIYKVFQHLLLWHCG
jgi:hypothetical protein